MKTAILCICSTKPRATGKSLQSSLTFRSQQMTYVTHSDAGEGLIFYGNVILPFIDRFPQDTELYRVMTTKPGEVSA